MQAHVTRPRVLAIGLDGLEPTLAEEMMDQGELPALAALRRRAARFTLDHGPAQRTGLAWEHVASGLSPEAGRRFAAVEFDPASYEAWQEGARFTPWWTGIDRRVVVFDAPYVDLRRAPRTRGLVAWGAHDPGTVTTARPADLLPEFERRFGRYPATEWTYGLPWPSAAKSRRMGEALTHAIGLRSRAARWLATQRLPDWDFFLAVVGELHGAVEGLWHGVDPAHPLHTHPSGAAAGRALRDIHRATDRMVADLMETAGDAAVVAFNMGGMGPNHSDVQSMVLLPELLYRHAFGRALLSVPPAWAAEPDAIPLLAEDDHWHKASPAWVPWVGSRAQPGPSPAARAAFGRLPSPVRALAKGARAVARDWRAHRSQVRLRLDWQPVSRYRAYWPAMPAFALPSFYDGRIRINLRGRERHGVVEPSRYEDTCRELEALLRECRDPRTGEPAVLDIERTSTPDPLTMTGSESDLLVVWRGVAAAIEHPRLGVVGPVALRRTGGHTGRYGVAYLTGTRLAPGDHGVRSSFDVVPTIAAMLGAGPRPGLSGKSLLG
jgi:predicted AlkP superfamily phosphohydrolase/phosphomutase